MTHSNFFAPKELTIYQIEQLYNEWRHSNDSWQTLDLSDLSEIDAAGLQFVVSLLKQPDVSIEVLLPTDPQLAECIHSALDSLRMAIGGEDA